MTITPTDRGALIAGGVFWTLVWTVVLKLDSIPLLNKFLQTKRILNWIRGHVALTLVLGEVVNMSMHPPTSPASALFAFGGTIVNVIAVGIVWLTGQGSKKKFV